MKIKDFELLFNDKDFPIKWKKEYLQLLTTFEVRITNSTCTCTCMMAVSITQVAVEFKKGKLLIPSHLTEQKPVLPNCIPPEDIVSHTIVIGITTYHWRASNGGIGISVISRWKGSNKAYRGMYSATCITCTYKHTPKGGCGQ